MNEDTKRVVIGVIAVIAVVVAGVVVFANMGTLTGNQETQVVGTLDMGPGGGRDAERGTPPTAPAGTDPTTGEAVADQASGMPADMVNPGN